MRLSVRVRSTPRFTSWNAFQRRIRLEKHPWKRQTGPMKTLETLETLCSTLFRNPPSRTHLIARDKRRRALVQKHQAKRQELKRRLKDRHLSPQERLTAQQALNALPRNSSASRVSNRCIITGRSKGVYRRYKISRIMLRQLALQGRLPGMKKASW